MVPVPIIIPTAASASSVKRRKTEKENKFNFLIAINSFAGLAPFRASLTFMDFLI